MKADAVSTVHRNAAVRAAQLTSILGEQPSVGGGVGAQVAPAKQNDGRPRLEDSPLLLCVINKALAVLAAVSIRYKFDVIANACHSIGHEAVLHTLRPGLRI